MNNLQRYLSIGIPGLLVVQNIIQSQRLIKVDRLGEQQHKDSMTLQSYMIPLHERMARLELSN